VLNYICLQGLSAYDRRRMNSYFWWSGSDSPPASGWFCLFSFSFWCHSLYKQERNTYIHTYICMYVCMYTCICILRLWYELYMIDASCSCMRISRLFHLTVSVKLPCVFFPLRKSGNRGSNSFSIYLSFCWSENTRRNNFLIFF